MSFIIDPYRFVAAGEPPINLGQSDTAATCGFGVYCSGRSANAGAGAVNASFDCREGGSGSGTTSITIYRGSTNVAALVVVTNALGVAGVWDGGTHSVNMNLTTAAGNITMTEIHVCRVNSSCTSQESLGSWTGSIDCSTATVKSQDVTTSDSGTAADTDKLAYVFVFTNTHAHQERTLVWTRDQTINTPILS